MEKINFRKKKRGVMPLEFKNSWKYEKDLIILNRFLEQKTISQSGKNFYSIIRLWLDYQTKQQYNF